MGTDQKVLVLNIDFREIANEIPDVGSHTEFVDLADIDRDSHIVEKRKNRAVAHFDQL